MFLVRIFHTADVHLGLKFVRASLEAVRQKLVEARHEVLSRMVQIANQEKSDLLVIAGDLFDNLSVSPTLVRKAAEHLRRFEGLVVILPGNHDYVQAKSEDTLWASFAELLGDRHLILREAGTFDLRQYDLPVVLYACPCRTRHSKSNALGWVREASTQDPSPHIRVGIAHGSLEGLSPDFNSDYFPMTHQELQQAGMDMWLLGHTHVRYPDRESGKGDRIFYSSVPEPDGFDCRHGGSAWIIDLEPNGTLEYRSVATGAYRFHELQFDVHGEQDFKRVRDHLSKLSPTTDLVKLELTGRLESGLYAQLGARIQEFETMTLHLEADVSGMLQLIQQADIDDQFTEGSIPYRLLSELAFSKEDQLALQMAFQLIEEARL
jgi:exonuclease SbcD